MERNSSLPCSEQPATGPCPEPDQSRPRPRNIPVRVVFVASGYVVILLFISGLFNAAVSSSHCAASKSDVYLPLLSVISCPLSPVALTFSLRVTFYVTTRVITSQCGYGPD
jgi:hypothetical protein